MVAKNKLAMLLRTKRLETGFTQFEFAQYVSKELGIGINRYKKLESGQSVDITINEMNGLIELLNINYNEFAQVAYNGGIA